MMASPKPTKTVPASASTPQPVLDAFYNLISPKETIRLEAASLILSHVEVNY